MKKLTLLLSALLLVLLLSCGDSQKSEIEKIIAEQPATETESKSAEIVDQVRDPDAIEGGYEELTTYDGKRNWTVTYQVFINQNHPRGYIIISEVAIGELTYVYDDVPERYMTSIHNDLIYSIVDNERSDSIRCGTEDCARAFKMLRVGEDIIRGFHDTGDNPVPWAAVVEAGKRQIGRRYGIPPQ